MDAIQSSSNNKSENKRVSFVHLTVAFSPSTMREFDSSSSGTRKGPRKHTAMLSLPIAIKRSLENPESQIDGYERDIDFKVQVVLQRSLPSHLHQQTNQGHQQQVQTLTYSLMGSGGLSIPNRMDECGDSYNAVCPIRLEVEGSLDLSSKEGKMNLDLVSIVILHNMGVLFVLTALETPNDVQRIEGILSKTSQVFTLSRTLLSTLQASAGGDMEVLTSLLQLELTVLRSLIPVLQELGRIAEADQLRFKLICTQNMIIELEGKLKKIFCVRSSAPAA